MTNFGFTADYDPPRILVVVVIPVMYVPTTVQKFIVVVSAATAVATTVQKFIVKEGREEGREDKKFL